MNCRNTGVIKIKFDDTESVITFEFNDISDKLDKELQAFLLSKVNVNGEAVFDTSPYKGQLLAPEEIISFEFLKYLLENKI